MNSKRISEITYKASLSKEEVEDALTEYCVHRGLLPFEFSWSFKSMKMENESAVITFKIGENTRPEDHEHETLTENEIPLPLSKKKKSLTSSSKSAKMQNRWGR